MCTKLYSKEVLAFVDHPTHVDAIKERVLLSKSTGPNLRDIDAIYTRDYDL